MSLQVNVDLSPQFLICLCMVQADVAVQQDWCYGAAKLILNAAKLLLNCSQTGVTAWTMVKWMLQCHLALMLQCIRCGISQTDVAAQCSQSDIAVQLMLPYSLMLPCSLTDVSVQSNCCCSAAWLRLQCSLTEVAVQSDWCCHAVWLMLPCSLTDVATQSDVAM